MTRKEGITTSYQERTKDPGQPPESLYSAEYNNYTEQCICYCNEQPKTFKEWLNENIKPLTRSVRKSINN